MKSHSGEKKRNLESPTIPFLKWAGGKRWLIRRFPELVPAEFKTYHEPFLGSGAVFFHLSPLAASISDSNQELISTYLTIRDEPGVVMKKLRTHDRNHSDDYYYRIRSTEPSTPSAKAARFIYLNRTCWNGLYRVNRRGIFNVPRGTKDTVVFPADDFEALSKVLHGINIECGDFEAFVDRVSEGDFLFIDPPYTVKHNYNGFLKYNQSIFSWDDQIRLAHSIKRAAMRGAKILVLNANHKSVRDLYKNVGNKVALPRHSVLAADSERRTKTHELAVIINYTCDNGPLLSIN